MSCITFYRGESCAGQTLIVLESPTTIKTWISILDGGVL